MKKIIVALAILAAFVSGIAFAQSPAFYTLVGSKFVIDEIRFVPAIKECSSTYSFKTDGGEVVKRKTLYLDCKPIPGIANAIKYVTAQIGIAEGRVIPDLPDVTK